MVEKSRLWSLCVHQLCKHIFIPLQVDDDSCLSLAGLSGWVVFEVSQNYVLGMGFSFALQSKNRELCQSEPSQEFA